MSSDKTLVFFALISDTPEIEFDSSEEDFLFQFLTQITIGTKQKSILQLVVEDNEDMDRDIFLEYLVQNNLDENLINKQNTFFVKQKIPSFLFKSLIFNNPSSTDVKILESLFPGKIIDFYGTKIASELDDFTLFFWEKFTKNILVKENVRINELDSKTTLLISNLLPNHTKEDIQELFKDLRDQIIYISVDKQHAVVSFKSEKQCLSVISTFNLGYFDNQQIFLQRIDGFKLVPAENPRFVRINASTITEAIQKASKFGPIIGVRTIYEVAFDNDDAADRCMAEMSPKI